MKNKTFLLVGIMALTLLAACQDEKKIEPPPIPEPKTDNVGSLKPLGEGSAKQSSPANQPKETTIVLGSPDVKPREMLDMSKMPNGASMSGKVKRYVVVRGDNLWAIAAMPVVYKDGFKWPLIYKANVDRITDPDMIYPGLKLKIRHDYSADEIRRAIEHAKNRGNWKLGIVEDSDRSYVE